MTPTGLPRDGHWIYLIINRVNNKVYVGKSRNPWRRCRQYIYYFKKGGETHLNEHLFNAISKYGIAQFVFRVWERCASDDQSVERELFWMDRFETTDRSRGYNLRRDSQLGMVTHPETRAKISRGVQKNWDQGIVFANHGEKMKAAWANDPERRIAQSKRSKKMRTKYLYWMWRDDEEPMLVNYEQLVGYGLKSAPTMLRTRGTDFLELHGHKIRQVPAHAEI